ncbi:MAG: hypothetical protein N3G19_03845 [Candidatus Pacearchaeota archaeon]|nr:hypothetical protein [Candidatus Pacearchaeota archaeon]
MAYKTMSEYWRNKIATSADMARRVTATIKKESDGYYVYSESGKNLGGPYKTKEEAEKRLRQVEYFKHKKAWKKDEKNYIAETMMEKKMATRADLEQKYGDATKAIAEKAIGIAQSVRRMYGGVHAIVIKPHTDQINIKARQLYNETHTQIWTTNDVLRITPDKMKIRAEIENLQRDIRKINNDIPVGMARVVANQLLDSLRRLRQAIDNL